MKKGKILAITLLVLSFLYGMSYAMKISPAVITMYIKPGIVHEGKFEVTNTSDGPVIISTEFRDSSDWERILEDPNTSSEDYQGWLEVLEDGVELGPGEVGTISYRVSAPEKGIRGELKGHVFFEQHGVAEDEDSITMVARIGNAIYVIIRGTENIQAEITELVYDQERQSIRVGINNLSNVHIRPKGVVTFKQGGSVVKGDGGEGVLELAVNEVGHPLMVGESMKFAVPIEGAIDPGSYEATIALKFGNPVVTLTETVNVTYTD